MKIISIEGLDKAGKNTASDILYTFFKAQKVKVEKLSVPNYDSPIGKIIRDWLTGDFKADTKVFELLHGADKQHTQEKLLEFESDGVEIVIIDRYTHSFLAYGSYDNDFDWLKSIQKYMRKPDITIHLDVNPNVSMNRRGKFGDNDKYESDLKRLEFTYNKYIELFEDEDFTEIITIDANNPLNVVKSELVKTCSTLYKKYIDKDFKDDYMDEVALKLLLLLNE